MWTYNYLCHFGILGQKWGVRRFQNEDGTLTEEGKQRYEKGSDSDRMQPTEYERKEVQRYKDLLNQYFYDPKKSDYRDPYYYKNDCPKDVLKKLNSYSKTSNGEKLSKEMSVHLFEKSQANREKQDYLNSPGGKLERIFDRKTFDKTVSDLDLKIKRGEDAYSKAYLERTLNALDFVRDLKKDLKDYPKEKQEEILAYAFWYLT